MCSSKLILRRSCSDAICSRHFAPQRWRWNFFNLHCGLWGSLQSPTGFSERPTLSPDNPLFKRLRAPRFRIPPRDSVRSHPIAYSNSMMCSSSVNFSNGFRLHCNLSIWKRTIFKSSSAKSSILQTLGGKFSPVTALAFVDVGSRPRVPGPPDRPKSCLKKAAALPTPHRLRCSVCVCVSVSMRACAYLGVAYLRTYW